MAVVHRQVRLAKDEKQLEGSGGGLKRDFVFVVENAEYGYKDEYNAAVEDGQKRLMLFWHGYDRDTQEEHTESFTMGSGWFVPNPDEPFWAEHPEGFEEFSRATVVGQMVAKASAKAKPKERFDMREGWIKRYGGMPDPRDAGMWNGGIFQMGAQKYDKYGSPRGTGDGERTIPVKFLGWVDEPTAPKNSAPAAESKPKASATKKAGANGASSVLDQLTALAGSAASFQDWQTKAILVPGLGTDPQLMPKITDEAFYESLKA